MAVNPLKIFLFLLGVAAAGGATAFVSGALDPYIYGKGAGSASVSEVPPPAPANPAAPKDQRLPGAETETPPPATPAPGTMAATPPAEGTTPPAGTMAATPPEGTTTPPGAMAALPPAEGTAPPATTAPTPPAEAGATPPADAAAQPPTAPQVPTFDIVRVQEDGSVVVAGKALADSLVELLSGSTVLGSGKATPEGDFVIVLDEPLKPGDYQLTLRATPPSGAAVASLQTAVLSVPDKPGGQVLAMVEQPGEPSQILAVPEPGKPADGAAAPAETPPAAASETKPGEQAVPPADAGQPAAEEPADGASAPAATAPAPADATPPAPEVAANPPADAGKPAAPAPAGGKVAVEAVEIEGNKIFIAGVGEPGRGVRVYANEDVLGEAKVDPSGRFLVEAVRELPVGQYLIRADLLDADGVTVLARAVVPFEREEGEAIAAVAPPASNPPPADKPAEGAAAGAETTPPATAGDQGKPSEAAGTEQTPPANGAPATPPASAAGEPPAAGTVQAPAGTEPPAVAAAEPVKPAEPAAPADAGAAAQPKQEEAATPPATAEQPGTEVAAAPAPETTAPKLVTVTGSVIIRRGDTLWRISKRVYGRGTRYSTIYLANQPQIADPDRIWPGQVFQVPDKSKEGEPADMKALGDQMLTAPAEQSAGSAQ